MSGDRLTTLVSAALRSQRALAFQTPAQRLDPALVAMICGRPAGPMTLSLPAQPPVDDEIRMAARNGRDEGLPPDLLAELEDFEARDQEDDAAGDDRGQ
jgi:hypothetical protein